MKLNVIYLFLLCLLFENCTKNEILKPIDNKNIEGTQEFPNKLLTNFEGIYKINYKNNAFGEYMVCKTSKSKVSFFGSKGNFIVLNVGLSTNDTSIRFSGFWRNSESTQQGAIEFTIEDKKSVENILLNGISIQLEMKGLINSTENITLVKEREFAPIVKNKEFIVFAHHGVLNLVNPPFSPNSIDMILNVEDYGAKGLEVDVVMTKDNIPVLFHDFQLNPSNSQKSGVIARIDQLNFSALTAIVRLPDGQNIPSVKEALKIAIDSTTLNYFWLDIKGNIGIFNYLEPIIKEAEIYAKSRNRKFEIITDITTEEVLEEFRNYGKYKDLNLMSELSLENALEINAKYWAPRWTLGTLNEKVNQAHNQNLKVYTWTINSESIVIQFLKDGNFDGMVTDYPCYPIYHYYIKQ